ncbi:MAG TPA: dienelactone hydrolase family protein [Bryobacteraceae bacterium]|nr:dienelactone hydrolase family protein [Bryobacteraceae bacterium]
MYNDDEQDPVHELVHLYVDGAFDRRELWARVTRLFGSGAAAATALGGYSELLAQTPSACPADVKVPLDAPDIVAKDVVYAAEGAQISAHFAYPRDVNGKIPGVIVIHENRGLVEHIKDVCRRVARAGFAAIAPDLLSRQGGVGQFPEAQQQTAAYGRTVPYERRLDLIGALDYLKFTPFVHHDRIGAVGFCAGGGNVWDLVVNLPELAAAVPFYGSPVPAVEDVQKIATPVLMIYAERDRALTGRVAPVMTELLARQKVFGFRVYEGVGHAFHNDTGANYDAGAACAAWAETIAYFNKWLRVPHS